MAALATLAVAAPLTAQPDARLGGSEATGADAPARRAEREEERLLGRRPILDDALLTSYLAGMVARLRSATGSPGELRPIHVVVLRDRSRNAFSLPHGGLYVSTGLLARLGGEDQLAMILARETAHLIRNDAARLAPLRPVPGPAHLFRALGLDLAYTAAVTGFGPDAERAADATALTLLDRAGFDVDEAMRAFDDLRRALGDERHPETFRLGNIRYLDDRRGSLAGLRLDRPPAAAPAGRESEDDFWAAVRVAVRENAVLEARAGGFATARAQLARALRLAPGDPVAHVYAGDIDRLEAQHRARATERQELKRDALIAYERAALLDPSYPEPFQRLGLLHYASGDYLAARQAFERYLALAPPGPEARRVREYLVALAR